MAHEHTHTHSHEHSHEHPHEHGCKHCHNHHHGAHGEHKSGGFAGFCSQFKLELISGLLFIAGVILNAFHIFDLIVPSGYNWTELIYYVIAVAPVGWPVLKEALGEWSHGDILNEFTLMLAAAVGAFVIGEFPEAVAVLLFYSFGEKLEDRASDDVKGRIKSLLGRLPSTARVEKDGKTVEMKPEEVQPHSIVAVLPGERVPIDGKLLGTTETEFDTSAITGESVPRAFKPGEEISSGMIPIDREIRVETLRPFADSSMSRIMQMIEEASSRKSHTETALRRITRWYTPAVFVLALLLVAVPWIISLFPGGAPFEWMTWFRRSLVFLVCSCPCALVVSVPLSYFMSLGVASREGMLFKGSKYLEALRKIRVVALDKTGTITTGSFHVSAILPAPGATEGDVLATAAALDAGSAHPLARAIVVEAGKRGLSVPKADDALTVPHGMTGTVGGRKAAVGSRTLMKKLGIDVPADKSDATEICVALDGKWIGTLSLLDDIKPEARQAIADLHRLGVKDVVVLSGDREAAVARVAKAVGADSWESSLLPADKKDYVEKRVDGGDNVMFVGDGINDAPAIAAANVGAAMGTMGTGMAMQSADMVIAGDRLDRLPQSIRLARKVNRVVIENVTFALVTKAVVMILGAFGIATLWAAVFADTGVTLIAVLWTILVLGKVGTRHGASDQKWKVESGKWKVENWKVESGKLKVNI